MYKPGLVQKLFEVNLIMYGHYYIISASNGLLLVGNHSQQVLSAHLTISGHYEPRLNQYKPKPQNKIPRKPSTENGAVPNACAAYG